MSLSKEIVVYQSLPYNKFKWVGYITVMEAFFLITNLFLIPTPRLIKEREEAIRNKAILKPKESPDDLDEYILNPAYDNSTILQKISKLQIRQLFTFKNVKDNALESPLFSLGIISASGLVTGAMWLLARRTLHMITLLPKDRVRLTSFSPFSTKPPKFAELPLNQISCVVPRVAEKRFCILKVKDHFGYFLVDKVEGKFTDPELYDQHMSFTRPWADKK